MEKPYVFFDTGTGCLMAVVLYSAAVFALLGAFLVIPEPVWLHLMLSTAVFFAVTWHVFALDTETKNKRKINEKRAGHIESP